MFLLILGLVVFLGIHSTRVFAPAFRERMIAERGERTWKLLYAVFSIIGFVLLIYGYGAARLDNVFFYSAPTWFAHILILLMIPVMILLVASQLPAGRIKKAVKNPMLLATKIWAIGHMAVNGDLASWLLFGTFLAWAVIVLISTKKRGQTFPQETSTMSDVLSVVVGLGAWFAFAFWLHEWLFGVAVIA
ncbi:MAG: NnrU family protein [Pseudomonadota bacterium]